MKQTRRQAMVETVVSTIIGLVFSLLVQTVLVWAYNVKMTHSQNIQFVFWFTIASMVRGYGVRRLFDWWHHTVIWFKGATAYEFQVGHVYLRVTHLRGAYWAWKPWRRISIHKEKQE